MCGIIGYVGTRDVVPVLIAGLKKLEYRGYDSAGIAVVNGNGVDVVRACENWVRGRAWDETFTEEMVEDELSVHERKAGQELPPLERERLLQLWSALYDERHRQAA